MADRKVRWEQNFGMELSAPKRARMGLAAALADVGLSPELMDDAMVVLSELVGNAVRHARTEFSVLATYTEGILRIEVLDLDTRPPSLLGLDSKSTSGRGLHIIAGIANDWGWQTAEGPDAQAGKVVWAELAGNEAAATRELG